MKLRWNWRRWPFALAAFLFAAAPAMAHEKWFVDENVRYYPLPDVFQHPTLYGAAVIGLAAAVFVAFWAGRRLGFGKRFSDWFESRIGRTSISARTILGVVLGVLLMGSGLQHRMFSPNLVLPATAFGSLLALAEISLGTAFIFLSPIYPELGIALAALFLAGLAALPFWDYMEELMMLGIAIFFITGATDRLPWKRWNTMARQRFGYEALRILTGLNFLVLAFVKWLRPDLGMAVVDQHHLNFMAWAGITTAQFVFCAAVVETFVALAILTKVAFRPAIVVAFTFFMLTIFVLGFTELLGHLPIKSVLFILFLVGDWKKGESKTIP